MDGKAEFVVHEDPVWRERANFLLHAKVDVKENVVRFEQLWVRQIADNIFEICSIPFFVYNLALGDQVDTEPDYQFGNQYVLREVLKPSGRFTFRVWFYDSEVQHQVTLEIQALGCLIERLSKTGHLIAVDAKSDLEAQVLANMLLQKEHQGILVYETGKI